MFKHFVATFQTMKSFAALLQYFCAKLTMFAMLSLLATLANKEYRYQFGNS